MFALHRQRAVGNRICPARGCCCSKEAAHVFIVLNTVNSATTHFQTWATPLRSQTEVLRRWRLDVETPSPAPKPNHKRGAYKRTPRQRSPRLYQQIPNISTSTSATRKSSQAPNACEGALDGHWNATDQQTNKRFVGPSENNQTSKHTNRESENAPTGSANAQAVRIPRQRGKTFSGERNGATP